MRVVGADRDVRLLRAVAAQRQDRLGEVLRDGEHGVHVAGLEGSVGVIRVGDDPVEAVGGGELGDELAAGEDRRLAAVGVRHLDELVLVDDRRGDAVDRGVGLAERSDEQARERERNEHDGGERGPAQPGAAVRRRVVGGGVGHRAASMAARWIVSAVGAWRRRDADHDRGGGRRERTHGGEEDVLVGIRRECVELVEQHDGRALGEREGGEGDGALELRQLDEGARRPHRNDDTTRGCREHRVDALEPHRRAPPGDELPPPRLRELEALDEQLADRHGGLGALDAAEIGERDLAAHTGGFGGQRMTRHLRPTAHRVESTAQGRGEQPAVDDITHDGDERAGRNAERDRPDLARGRGSRAGFLKGRPATR